MKKILTLLIALVATPLFASAQQSLNPKEMIGITPMLSQYLDVPEDARNSLNIKLGQMATQNGFGSNSGDFILTANLAVLDKQATATAPVQFIVEMEVSVYVLNVAESVVVDELSFVTKGIGNYENKAIISAINQIKPKSSEVRSFMGGVRTKIIDYYNTRMPAILAKAQSLADRDEYAQALAVLAPIPEVVDQYPVVADQMAAIYIKMVDKEAVAAILKAKGMMAQRNYEDALEALMAVNPSSTKSSEAFAMIDQIKTLIDERERLALGEKMREYEDRKQAELRGHELAKLSVGAARQVVAQQVQTEATAKQMLDDWFLGKFK